MENKHEKSLLHVCFTVFNSSERKILYVVSVNKVWKNQRKEHKEVPNMAAADTVVAAAAAAA